MAERKLLAKYGKMIPIDDTEPRTRLYRILEAIETKIMLGTIRSLLTKGAKSIVWLHDGIYVDKDIHYETTRNIIQWKARDLGFRIDVIRRSRRKV